MMNLNMINTITSDNRLNLAQSVDTTFPNRRLFANECNPCVKSVFAVRPQEIPRYSYNYADKELLLAKIANGGLQERERFVLAIIGAFSQVAITTHGIIDLYCLHFGCEVETGRIQVSAVLAKLWSYSLISNVRIQYCGIMAKTRMIALTVLGYQVARTFCHVFFDWAQICSRSAAMWKCLASAGQALIAFIKHRKVAAFQLYLHYKPDGMAESIRPHVLMKIDNELIALESVRRSPDGKPINDSGFFDKLHRYNKLADQQKLTLILVGQDRNHSDDIYQEILAHDGVYLNMVYTDDVSLFQDFATAFYQLDYEQDCEEFPIAI